MTTTAILLLLGGAIFLFLRSRDVRPVPSRRRNRRSNPYQAASIDHREDACAAVRALGDTRFLAWEAPGIPVSECTADTCDCRYVYHQDRRRGQPDRRRNDDENTVEALHERRRGPDRRAPVRLRPGELRPVVPVAKEGRSSLH